MYLISICEIHEDIIVEDFIEEVLALEGIEPTTLSFQWYHSSH